MTNMKRMPFLIFVLLLLLAAAFALPYIIRDRQEGQKSAQLVLIGEILADRDYARLKKLSGDKEFSSRKDEAGRMPLHKAAINGDMKAVRIISEGGAEIDAKDVLGATPLEYAAAYNEMDIVRYLAGKGADINIEGYSDKKTPLHRAAEIDRNIPFDRDKQLKLEDIRFLLDNGARIDARDSANKTPLYLAVESGFDEAAVLLMDRGADINASDRNGETLLHAAAMNCDKNIMDELMKRGAAIREDAVDRAPDDIARNNKCGNTIINHQKAE